jgi:hypothetical protein
MIAEIVESTPVRRGEHFARLEVARLIICIIWARGGTT